MKATWRAYYTAQAEGRLVDVWDVLGGAAFDDSDHLPDAWAWDISRPIADQLAETAADDAAADALDAPVADDQIQAAGEDHPDGSGGAS